jgi:tetratricopeptide (TPR) repeat protein
MKPLLTFFSLALLTLASVPAAAPDEDAALGRMRDWVKDRKWDELIAQFKNEDLAAWTEPSKAAEAASLRAKAYVAIKNSAQAEKDLKLAVARSPKSGEIWHELGALYSGLLPDEALALEAYGKAFASAGKSFSWLPISATINEATVLLKQGKADKARKVMERYDSSDLVQMAAVWGDKMRAVNEQIAERLSSSLLVIADKGVSDYQIVLPDHFPTPAIGADLQQVARLLQTAFKANGADLPVVAETARDMAKPAIYLGATVFARAQCVQCEGWSYVHKAVGRDLILAGCDEPAPGRDANIASGSSFDRIGTAKAVTDFLQHHAGTRFLFPEQGGFVPLAGVSKVDLLNTPTIEYLPTPRIAVPPDLDVKKTPVLDFDITWPPTVSFYHLAQNRFPAIDSTFAGHTWHRAIPSDQAAFAAHPERFALLGGKRMLTGSEAQVQYCISNPEVRELLYQDLEKHFKLGFQTVDLGQPDGFRGCECDACTQMFGTGNDWSEKVWILHRDLAERAHKAYPDRTVAIAVYAITETLPKTFDSFPPNVRLWMCGTRDHELAAWKRFGAPQGFSTYLYYWCPNMMPRYFPMRTPLYVENAAKRLMAANVLSITRDGNGGTAYGLEGPTYYTMGRMFDGPGAHTAKDLVIEYVSAAFGKSAPAMMGFYDQLYNSLEIYSRYMATREDGWSFADMYGRNHKHLSSPESIIAFLYPVDLMEGMQKQLALAEKADLTPKVQTRLALVRAEFDYLKGVVNAVHLYNAYRISPDTASLDRLLNTIDSRRTAIDQLFARDSGLKGWPFTLFPPSGHNAEAMKLKHDGYQEPYKDSFFNWDTTAKRLAPLPNAKRLVAALASGTVTLDSPQWDKLQAQTFEATQVRAMYDDKQLHLRFDNDLPPDAKTEAIEKERVEAYLMPAAGSKVTFKFTAGLKPDSRTQAARGLIEDMMNLGYGKFDPLWKAEWTHSARHDAAAKRLTVMMTIPLRSIPPATVNSDQSWYVNFQRVSPAGVSTWSVIPGGSGIDDPRSNGEMTFNGDGSPSASHPLKALREKTYLETFETPSDWKDRIAKGPLLPLTEWRFRADPTEVGAKDEWFKPTGYSEADWLPVKVPSFWAESEAVGNLLGDGWYRVAFTIPTALRGRSLQFLFAGVDEQAWVYLNGQLTGEHSERSEKKAFTALYDEPFIVEVPADRLQSTAENVLHVRVHNRVGAGGIWRPVHVLVND